MRRALATLVAAVVALIGLPATTAQAQPACGTTPEQWVGYFPGFLHWGIEGEEDSPLDHTITIENGAIVVDTLVNGWKRHPLEVPPTLTGDSLSWQTLSPDDGGAFYERAYYTTDSVTCENGVVASFTGKELWILVIVGGPVQRVEKPFSASR